MSTKKLTASILLLVIGGLLITSGFVTNDYLRSEVSKGVPDALLAIKNQVEPEIEETVKINGVPVVLLGIKELALPEFEDNVEFEAILEILKTVKGEVILGINDMVNLEAIPEVLNGIKSGALPEIEKLLNLTAYLETLIGTKEQFLPTIEEMVKVQAIPPVLSNIYALAITELPLIINGSVAAKIINATITGVAEYVGLPLAKEEFFNNYTFQDNYLTTIEGVSERMTGGLGNLSYTPAAQNNLLCGNIGFPGIITDLEMGTGLLGFLQLYSINATDPSFNATMQFAYNATWGQLTALAGYITTYLWPIVVPVTLGMSAAAFAPIMFLGQWANGTYISGGIDLSLFIDDYDDPLYGLEVGIPNPSNISLTSAMALWDSMNSSAFVNDTGIQIWLNATKDPMVLGQLALTFSLDPYIQMPMLLNWLFTTIKDDIVPILLEITPPPDGLGMSPAAYSEILFYKQWANGTVMLDDYPNGIDFSEFLELPGSLFGFEVGIFPYGSNISLMTATDLWNPMNSNSFINDTIGLPWWLAALTNDTIAEQLSLTIGLSTAQMTMMRGWLGNWISIVAPTLFYGQYQILLEDAPEYAFYEQWANGTIFNEEMFPGGVDFSLFFEEIQNSLIGFEIGLPPYPSNISFLAAKDLWDPTNSSSFTNFTIGFPKWKEAGISGDTAVLATLALTFGLNATTQMPLILNWLFTTVMNNFVPVLFALPDPYGKGMTTMAYARILFYDQWANGTLYSTGLDLGYGSELIGLLEVGVPTRSDISYMSAVELWDDTSIYAFVNDTGLQKWRDAATKLDDLFYLSMSLGLDILQMGLMLDWLDDIIDIFVPALFADPTLGRGMTIPAYAETLFYEQWANGTILGEKEYPQGLDLGDGLTGFEVGIPTASNITLAVCELLWNDLNVSTFVNDTGIGKWLDAATDTTIQDELRTTFGLNATQMS